MIYFQRPDIAAGMLFKRKFPKLQCGLFTNNYHPRVLDTLEYYDIIQSVEVDTKWKCTLNANGWRASHPEEVEFFLDQSIPTYGYVVFQKNKLLWAERFNGAPFTNSFNKKGYSVGIKLNIFLEHGTAGF